MIFKIDWFILFFLQEIDLISLTCVVIQAEAQGQKAAAAAAEAK